MPNPHNRRDLVAHTYYLLRWTWPHRSSHSQLVLPHQVSQQTPHRRCPGFPCQAFASTSPSIIGRRPSPPLLATNENPAKCSMHVLPLISSRATARTAPTSPAPCWFGRQSPTTSPPPYPAGTPMRLSRPMASRNRSCSHVFLAALEETFW
jgi:hypothetical protein